MEITLTDGKKRYNLLIRGKYNVIIGDRESVPQQTIALKDLDLTGGGNADD